MGRSPAGRAAPAPPPSRAAPACVSREEVSAPEEDLLCRGRTKGSHLYCGGLAVIWVPPSP